MAPGHADDAEPQAEVVRLPTAAPDAARVLDLQRAVHEARLAEARALRERRLSEAGTARAASDIAELEARLRSALEERTAARLEIERVGRFWEAVLAARDAELAAAAGALRERDAVDAKRRGELDELRGRLASARTERERALERLGARTRQLEALRGSRSYRVLHVLWRLHAAIGRPLRGRG